MSCKVRILWFLKAKFQVENLIYMFKLCWCFANFEGEKKITSLHLKLNSTDLLTRFAAFWHLVQFGFSSLDIGAQFHLDHGSVWRDFSILRENTWADLHITVMFNVWIDLFSDVNMAVERRQAKPQSQQSPPRR